MGRVEFPVALKRSKEGYAVWCPSLPGCCSQGATKAEALGNAKEAIAEYLSVAKALAKRRGGRLVKVKIAI